MGLVIKKPINVPKMTKKEEKRAIKNRHNDAITENENSKLIEIECKDWNID